MAEYLSFLRLLDDSQLIGHINSFSQDASEPAKELRHGSLVTSTPAKNVVSSFESVDPFDDGLDSILVNLDHPAERLLSTNSAGGAEAENQPPTQSSNGSIPGNQLVLLQETHTAGNDIQNPIESSSGVATVAELANSSTKNLHNHDDSDDSELEPDAAFGQVGPLHEFGDYGTYFHNKVAKQQKADESYIKWDQERRKANGEDAKLPPVFAGCKIFVNGNTIPTLGVIHKLVISHGGVFLNYLPNKGAATHIVCDRLTPRKKLEYRNYKVVRAQWIVDSVKQTKLLDWKQYRLIEDLEWCQKQLGFEVLESLSGQQDQGDQTSKKAPVAIAVREGSEPLRDNFDDLRGTFANADAIIGAVENEGDFAEDELEEEPEPLQLNVAQNDRSHVAMDAKHPDFLAHFFANSRLHHLSTWKADLRSKFLRMIASKMQSTQAIKSQDANRVILHIDFDCFFATASALSHPELDINRDPIAVSHGGKSSDVASCNYVARAHGVTNGLWLGNAMQKCPQLKILDYDFPTYEKLSGAFYNYLVGREVFDHIFPVSIDEVLVDCTKHCGSYEGNREEAVTRLCREIRQDVFALTQCPVSIGASKNVLLAKLATKKAKPNGFFFLHNNVDDFMKEMKVTDIPGVGRSVHSRLAEELKMPMPVKIHQVQKLSNALLGKLFGEKSGAKLFHSCRGEDDTSISLDLSSSEAVLGRKSVSVDVNFGIRFDNNDQAERFLIQLSRELHSRLIDLGVCGSALTLKLARRAPGAPVVTPKFLGLGMVDFFSKSSRLGVPTNDWGIIGSELKSLFRMLNIPVQELRGIAIMMTRLEDIETVKKQRQKTLDFSAKAKRAVPKENSQDLPHAEQIVNGESIDWDVFNELPPSLKMELKKELLRRGIPVSKRERSPRKELPLKGDGRKVYMQQMFPLQPHGQFKMARVIESPTKKKRRTMPSPVKLTVKEERSASPAPYNETVSYDDEVLKEIPSSIQREFMEELEWQRKNKRLVFVSARQKLEQKSTARDSVVGTNITAQWLQDQQRLVVVENFAGLPDFESIKKLLRDWIASTIEYEGPHDDDIAMFKNYLVSLLTKGQLSRVLSLMKVLKDDVSVQETCALLSVIRSLRDAFERGLGEWQACVENLEASVRSTLSQLKPGIQLQM